MIASSSVDGPCTTCGALPVKSMIACSPDDPHRTRRNFRSLRCHRHQASSPSCCRRMPTILPGASVSLSKQSDVAYCRFASAPSLDDLPASESPLSSRSRSGLKISAPLMLPAHIRRDQSHHIVVECSTCAPGEWEECADLHRKHPLPGPLNRVLHLRCLHGAHDWQQKKRRRAAVERGRRAVVSCCRWRFSYEP